MQMDGSRLTDRVAAQAGHDFPGLGPRCGLERGTRCAQAGRLAFFVFGLDRSLARGSHCARAGRGRFSYLGWIAAWRTDRTVHERTVGRFSYSGRIRVMNSNFS
jgi:hypothetical protein